MTDTTPAGVRPVKSALRAIQILEYLASSKADPPRLQEISTAVDAPRSSVYAVLRTLQEVGWVQVDDDGRYRLGVRALTVGTSYIDADPYVRIAAPILADLANSMEETFHLGRLDGDEVVYLLTQQSDQSVRTWSRVGRRMPASATGLGKSLLAYRTNLELEDLPALTPHTITDLTRLKKDLEETRNRGYAIDREENVVGLRCIAFALPYSDPVTDAISCSIPVRRYSPEHVREIIDHMRMAVDRIVVSAPITHA